MLDDVYKAKNLADVFVLGNFNIDMLKPHSCWDSTLVVFGFARLITSPTRTTPTSTSLIDHIYTNNPSAVVTTDVSDLRISNHNPAPDLSNCQNQNPKDIHKCPLDLLNILTRMHYLLILFARRLTVYINTRTLTRL